MKQFILSCVLSVAAIAPSQAQQTTRQLPVYLDQTKPVEQRIDDAISRMTLAEKIRIIHAQSKFSSAGVPRLGFPDFWTDDGPHGVRPDVLWDEWEQAGQTNDSCVAFPALTCLAASWNPQMSRIYGEALGEEALYRGKDMILGPGVNIYRTPLNGRNFEYMGEDPFLASIMGHRMADLDALGSAVGLLSLCRAKGRPARIVIDLQKNACQSLIAELKASQEYADLFISGQDALVEADNRSLLIVVDTNRPEQVECRPLLESISRVAVIDHHRRAADYIEQPVLNLHEPYASSASELVTELLQYAVNQRDVKPLEAQALLAGIVLDTKNFSVRTGSRTFESAAYLRKAGADPVEVKKLFQNDLDDTLMRYRVVQAARLYRSELAIACMEETITRVIASQAADELINISGITASFVLFPDGEQVIISARSIGSCNVQAVLEKLGGGGNGATAGAQIKGKPLREVLQELVAAIDAFYA